MKPKLISLMLFLAFLSGCGASEASDAAAPDHANSRTEHTSLAQGSYVETTAPQAATSGTGYNIHETPEASDEKSEDQTHYFVFTRSNEVTLAKDETEILHEYRCNTEFSAQDQELEYWVDSVLYEIQQSYDARSENLKEYAQESLEIIGKEMFYGYSNYQDMATSRHDDRVISLVVLNSVYSGGVHPNSVQTAWNLCLESKTILRLEDILQPGGEAVLQKMVLAQLEKTFGPLGDGALFDDYTDTVASAFRYGTMTPYWYFNSNGLVIFFNQYELGPYAAGIIKLEFTYEELQAVLSEVFLPGVAGYLNENLSVCESLSSSDAILIPCGVGEDQILLCASGDISEIRVSEVSWLGDLAIGQKMLFSANRITDRDLLKLIGVDSQISLAVEYRIDDKKTEVRYIHPDGLTQTP